MAEAPDARYHFGARDRGGPVLGLRTGQACLLGITAALTVLALLGGRGRAGVALAVAIAIGGAALAALPIGGRGADEWLPVLLHWVRHPRRQWRSRAAQTGHLMVVREGELAAIAALRDLPPALRGIRLLRVATSRGDLGVVHDRAAGNLVAVVRVRGRSYALLAERDKQRALAAWGGLLAARAHRNNAIARIQVLVRTVAEDPDALIRHLEEARQLPLSHPLLRSYMSLLDDAAPVSQTQEAYVVVAVNARSSARAIREAGGGEPGAAAVLVRELRLLQSQLERGGELEVDGALTPEMVALLLRESVDPTATASLRRSSSRRAAPGIAPESAAPHRLRRHWSWVETDSGACHASYWISEWPRVPVGTNFLVPLLLQTRAQLAWSVVMAPVEPERARREIESAQTSRLADEALRERHGFRTSIQTTREQAAIEQRERELADGHAEYRFSGYVTVTAASHRELIEACGEVEQQARNSRLDLRRMDGEHDRGLSCCMPLCRGLS